MEAGYLLFSYNKRDIMTVFQLDEYSLLRYILFINVKKKLSNLFLHLSMKLKEALLLKMAHIKEKAKVRSEKIEEVQAIMKHHNIMERNEGFIKSIKKKQKHIRPP